jgi:hypothetical protein
VYAHCLCVHHSHTHTHTQCLRDVSFLFKWAMAPSNRVFPAPAATLNGYSPHSCKPKWETRGPQLRVLCCDLDLLDLFVRFLETTDPFTTQRHPSGASASEHTAPNVVLTEDDVLHTRNLPEFGGALAQRDSELLLSYLTVGYIRLPLVVAFFSQEDRVHALRDSTIRRVLDSCVFEPGDDVVLCVGGGERDRTGRHLSPEFEGKAPVTVPADDNAYLATAFGALLNEVARAPLPLGHATRQLVALAIDMDTGSPFESSAKVCALALARSWRQRVYCPNRCCCTSYDMRCASSRQCDSLSSSSVASTRHCARRCVACSSIRHRSPLSR